MLTMLAAARCSYASVQAIVQPLQVGKTPMTQQCVASARSAAAADTKQGLKVHNGALQQHAR